MNFKDHAISEIIYMRLYTLYTFFPWRKGLHQFSIGVRNPETIQSHSFRKLKKNIKSFSWKYVDLFTTPSIVNKSGLWACKVRGPESVLWTKQIAVEEFRSVQSNTKWQTARPVALISALSPYSYIGTPYLSWLNFTSLTMTLFGGRGTENHRTRIVFLSLEHASESSGRVVKHTDRWDADC